MHRNGGTQVGQPFVWLTLSENENIVGTSHIVKNLDKGVKWDFQVLARNADGFSEPSEILFGVLAAEQPATPDAPVVTYNNKEYVFTWEAPDNGGSQITGYNVHILN
jgi:hypothetical protein